MQTPSTTQPEQAETADRHDAAALPRALSDVELATVAGGKGRREDSLAIRLEDILVSSYQ